MRTTNKCIISKCVHTHKSIISRTSDIKSKFYLYLQSEVGHFCAPLCPGFCQANLCIFHSDREDRVQSAVGDRTVQDPQEL